GGRRGGKFLLRRNEEVWPRLCLGRANQFPFGLLLDLGLWPTGAVCIPARLRSDHAGRKWVHVAQRISRWAAGADWTARGRHDDGHVSLQRHPAGAACPRPDRPRPACRGGAVRYSGGDDPVLRHGLLDDRRESEPSGQFAEWVSFRRSLPWVRRAVLYRLRQ